MTRFDGASNYYPVRAGPDGHIRKIFHPLYNGFKFCIQKWLWKGSLIVDKHLTSHANRASYLRP